MDPKLDRKFPCAADIESAALKRLPKFVGDYLSCGMGQGAAVQRNRNALDAIKLLPRYLLDADNVTFNTELFGRQYDAPFGIAPVGMGGLVWPYSAEYLAKSAYTNRIPFTASTFALTDLESSRKSAKDCAWFQLYRPNNSEVEQDILDRVEQAGYENLIITVDVPSPMRRDHDIRNGFSVPPQLSFETVWQIATHPKWSLAMARSGYPQFENLIRYVPNDLSKNDAMNYLTDMVSGHVTPGIIKGLRSRWKGKLIIKGILDADEAVQCRDMGIDGIMISNHGGRQLEAAPSPCEVIEDIRTQVGDQFTLIADGGVRSGLDICRMLSLGADFVMMGRPFYYAIAAMGPQGADHIIELFKAELKCVLGQLGCATIKELKYKVI